MNAGSIYKSSLAILLAALQPSIAVSAAPSPTPGKNPPQGKSTPAAVDPEIPQSIFKVPPGPKDGKDPFYPPSTRVYSSGAVKPATTPTVPIAMDFVLNGISPSADKPFAMINGRTFGKNEEGDVVTTAGRAHIKCVEIKTDSVVIEFRGVWQELKLRKGL